MDKKKEYINQLYLPLYVVFLLVLVNIFLVCFSGTNYAMGINEIGYYIQDFDSKIISSNAGYAKWQDFMNNDYENYIENISQWFENNNLSLANVSTFRISASSSSVQFAYILGDIDDYYIKKNINENNYSPYYISNNNSYTDNVYITQLPSITLMKNGVYIFSRSSRTYGLYPTQNVYTENYPNGALTIPQLVSQLGVTIYTNSMPQNSITLQANDVIKYRLDYEGQGTVSVGGNWHINEFKYYIQQKVNGEYKTLSNKCDWSLIDENNYNSAYLYCKDISSLPYGIYRFIAISESIGVSSWSNDFLLTYETVSNSATGIVDNGNIEINIDTGETVDNIKDYLGQPADTTEDEFKDNFPTVEIDDPSEDFFSWIFTQIENVFLSTSSEYFEFSLYTGNVYRINSNNIRVPDGVIKTLIGLSCDFSICYWIMKDVRKVINKIKEGNIEALANEDITANMV